MTEATPVIELRNACKRFGTVEAVKDVSFSVMPGEIHCLLGDNGAGKSTLIKILSGVHEPTEGALLVDGTPRRFSGPGDAMKEGIATVFQDLAMIPLMSISRNFFLGREPRKRLGPFKGFFDAKTARAVASAELERIGISIRDANQLVGTLSGGERQSVAIARAAYFGARVLILDEPTSALGVKEASVVLRYIVQARARGVAVVFITHNVHHAYPVGDRFTILNRGESYGTFRHEDTTLEEVLRMMAGGEELEELGHLLEEFAETDDAVAAMDERRVAEGFSEEARGQHGRAG